VSTESDQSAGDHDTACRHVLPVFHATHAARMRTIDFPVGAERGRLLETIASALSSHRDPIIAAAADETALLPAELAPEFDRMVGTLRMFSALVADGSWVHAAIDTPSGSAIGPTHDVRRLLVPLGPVAVFSASNFPLAYGVCGGDSASALAAGCPVVVKEHPAHPRTGRLLADIVAAAVGPDFVGYLENRDPADFGVAELLVPSVCAVGFTGSTGGGAAIQLLASAAPVPVPIFAEMGSVNPVIVTNAAAERRGRAIADELADSILSRFGQQCTCPGQILVPPGDGGDALVQRLAERIAGAGGRDMLAPWIRDAYVQRVDEVQRCRGVRLLARGRAKDGARGAAACLLSVDDLYIRPDDEVKNVFSQDGLRDEIFGPAAVVIRTFPDMLGDVQPRGSLTVSVYADGADDPDVEDLLDPSAPAGGSLSIAGRVIFNGPPTGVRVATAMVHGGPFPATNRPDTTAVGPRAIERWCRPVCFQNCPDALLPPELQNANPRGILRTLNGVPTRDAIA